MCRSRFVATVRNPLDIIVSMLGVSELEPSPENISAKIEELDRQGIRDSLWLRNHPRALILRYEDFYGDFETLFANLEHFLQASPTPRSKEDFKARFNIEAVKRKSEALESFEQFDSDDQIHGRHISEHSGQPGAHTALLDELLTQRIRDRFASFCEAFDY